MGRTMPNYVWGSVKAGNTLISLNLEPEDRQFLSLSFCQTKDVKVWGQKWMNPETYFTLENLKSREVFWGGYIRADEGQLHLLVSCDLVAQVRFPLVSFMFNSQGMCTCSQWQFSVITGGYFSNQRCTFSFIMWNWDSSQKSLQPTLLECIASQTKEYLRLVFSSSGSLSDHPISCTSYLLLCNKWAPNLAA